MSYVPISILLRDTRLVSDFFTTESGVKRDNSLNPITYSMVCTIEIAKNKAGIKQNKA